jgi:hypothetical protein
MAEGATLRIRGQLLFEFDLGERVYVDVILPHP